ncbi:hypothetical protein [Mesorhizobium sp. M0809]|uniref:hypothetical protein n=1 Tax=Mesorhizobium sp. M0809 TaxID=2957003 RepID=UPI00333BF5FC
MQLRSVSPSWTPIALVGSAANSVMVEFFALMTSRAILFHVCARTWNFWIKTPFLRRSLMDNLKAAAQEE